MFFGLRMKPGNNDRVPELIGAGMIAIGWNDARELIDPKITLAGFREVIGDAYPGMRGNVLTAAVRDTWRFLRELDVGDIVVVPHENEVYFVRVLGPPRFAESGRERGIAFQRDVVPLLGGTPVKRSDLPETLRSYLRFRNTTEDLAAVKDEINEVVAPSASGKMLAAIETKSGIRSGLKQWRSAFQAVGRTDHGFSPDMIWIDELGLWLKARGWKTNTGFRYWNGLGDTLGGNKDRNLVVEVNPPDGGPAGRWQGLVATDATGQLWILHTGEMNVRGKRVRLRQILEPDVHKSAWVQFADGTSKEYFVVAELDGDHGSITRQTRRFVDICLSARTESTPNAELHAKAQRKATSFEESIGTTIIPPQPQKEIDRLHAKVSRDLKAALRNKGFDVSLARVSGLAPDMYTICKDNPYLFEIKTEFGASDWLKGVGQLLVYEKVLEQNYRKYLVLPGNVGDVFVSVLAELNIRVVLYEWRAGKARFDWPDDIRK